VAFGLKAERCDHFFAVRTGIKWGGLVRFAGREGLHGWFHKKARGGVTKREGLVRLFRWSKLEIKVVVSFGLVGERAKRGGLSRALKLWHCTSNNTVVLYGCNPSPLPPAHTENTSAHPPQPLLVRPSSLSHSFRHK